MKSAINDLQRLIDANNIDVDLKQAYEVGQITLYLNMVLFGDQLLKAEYKGYNCVTLTENKSNATG